MVATVLDELIVKIGPKFTGGGDLRRLERGIDKAKAKLDSFGDAAIKIGAGLTAVGTGTLLAFADYEKGFAEMAAKTGNSMAELESLYGEAVRNIAKETGVSMSDVQNGFQKGLSAGMEGQELIDAVTQATKAQAAGIGRLEDTISSATTAWSVLGEDADEAMNIITVAAQKGEGETEDFGQALKGVVGFAKTLGVEFEELAGSLAATSQSAKSVPEAETQLRAFFKAIADPTQGAIDKLEELNAGFTFEDLRRAIREEDFASAYKTLHTYIDSLRAAGVDVAPVIAAIFPEVEAQQFFNTVDPDKIADLTAEIKGAGDEINRTFIDGEKTVDRQSKKMMRSFTDVAVTLGEKLVPVFELLNRLASRSVEWFDALPEPVKDIVAQVLAAGPAILALGIALRFLSFALSGVKVAAGIIAALASPVVAIIAAIAGAAGLAYKLYTDFGKGGLFDITEPFEFEADMFAWFGRQWQATVAGFKVGAQEVEAAWSSVKLWLADAPGDIWSWLTERVQAPFAWVDQAWGAMLSRLVGPLDDLWGWLTAQIAAPFEWVQTAWQTMLGWLTAPPDLWGWLKETVASPFQWVDDAWGYMLSRLVPPLDDLWAFLTPTIDGDTILLPIREAWQTVLAWLQDFSLAEVGAAIIGTLVDGINAAASEVVDAVTGAFDTVMEYMPFSDARRGPLSRLTESGRAIVDTLADGMRSATPLRAALASGVLALPAADALAAPLPLGPVPPSASAPASVSFSITLSEGAIRIDAPGADSQEIASRLGDALAEEMRAVVEELDSNSLA